MNGHDDEFDADSEHASSLSAWLRGAGLVAFVGGSVATAQTAAYDAHWGWIAVAAVAAMAGLVAMALGLRMELMAGRSRLTTPERARLRFDQWHGLWVVGYVTSFIFGISTVPDLENLALRVVLIAAPLVLMAVMVTEFVRMVVRSDEHQRAQHVAASAIGAGALIVGAAAWSTLGELMGGWPRIPGWTFLPAFAVAYVTALSLLNQNEA